MKPGTSAESVHPYLDKIEMVLVMTVEPGFGGQSFADSGANDFGAGAPAEQKQAAPAEAMDDEIPF